MVAGRNIGKLYTSITFLGTAAFLAWVVFVHKPAWLGRFYVGYAISLVPFFLVNGILTGWLLEEPIVWYNDAENLGIRMGTIPVEDGIYLLLLLLMITVCHEWPLKRDHGDPHQADRTVRAARHSLPQRTNANAEMTTYTAYRPAYHHMPNSMYKAMATASATTQ